jgi:hypothetical protein
MFRSPSPCSRSPTGRDDRGWSGRHRALQARGDPARTPGRVGGRPAARANARGGRRIRHTARCAGTDRGLGPSARGERSSADAPRPSSPELAADAGAGDRGGRRRPRGPRRTGDWRDSERAPRGTGRRAGPKPYRGVTLAHGRRGPEPRARERHSPDRVREEADRADQVRVRHRRGRVVPGQGPGGRLHRVSLRPVASGRPPEDGPLHQRGCRDHEPVPAREVFVTDDGGETDRPRPSSGRYRARLRDHNVTTGKVYHSVISRSGAATPGAPSRSSRTSPTIRRVLRA